MTSLKESYMIWKNKALNDNNFCLQRFVVPKDEYVFKYRIIYYVQKSQMNFEILNNFQTNLEVPNQTKKGWIRLKTFKSMQTNTLPEKYLVKGNNGTYNYDRELKEESLIEQMKSLRKIIEFSECGEGSYILTEIIADFIQDFEGNWYFLNVIEYKTEFLVTKKPKSSMPQVRKVTRKCTTFVISSGQLNKSSSLVDVPLNSKDLLREEVIKDLESTRIKQTKTSQELYRKAYHLKSTNKF